MRRNIRAASVRSVAASAFGSTAGAAYQCMYRISVYVARSPGEQLMAQNAIRGPTLSKGTGARRPVRFQLIVLQSNKNDKTHAHSRVPSKVLARRV